MKSRIENVKSRTENVSATGHLVAQLALTLHDKPVRAWLAGKGAHR